ncbi:DNA segregation ATPase FtsK/SpoIIIE, S-DNA-T family [Novimethylophilus kurashikiensis]|uniref:DNA segregation ATPase FtsK/SpoIIIE, S-DNA-T family n=1 Tax=Novimethylophilus kurashikiensis TaxID=1825523 RepID=A0A2R5F1S1_9PROT|nr:DNA translocase FtsK [Novimethylophilus kurashikiensis]GBG12627.1 DNA segregation ATPase FtsK/SpoIIIE, S-DNA-T family [Novimethylophilus kurashikiensis]
MLFKKTPSAIPNARSKVPAKTAGLLREASWLALVSAGLFVAATLASYHRDDPSWSHSTSDTVTIHNLGGVTGAWISDMLLYLFGVSAWWWVALAFMGIWWSYHRLESEEAASRPILFFHLLGFMLMLLASSALEAGHIRSFHALLPLAPGGMLGAVIDGGLFKAMGFAGSTLALLLAFAVGFSLFTGVSWLTITEKLGGWLENTYERIRQAREDREDRRAGQMAEQLREEFVETERKRVEDHPPVHIEAPVLEIPKSDRVEKERQTPLFETMPDSPLPPLHLLDEPQGEVEVQSAETLEFTSRLIERKLMDFNIEVKVTAAMPGPVITRYEFEPAAGVKGSQITNLAKDLARALSVISVRVVETIPGKSCMAIEIPNPKRQMVGLSEILGSQAYADMSSSLTMALGKDISGKPSVADLAKMPHVLVAGTTGSGKSVAINAMILSLLYKADASQVRLILVDPKMLELSVYEGIPHLLAPVVTDMRQASNALNWCVAEMEKRYRLMSALGVRNLAGFNQKIRDAQKEGNAITNPFSLTPDEPEPLGELPLIVVVIDELADMMMVVGKKVEELIARLAQKARASGIHLILATQRPSVDVITGLIKANIPTRIAFQVSSKIDSRTILDQMGAEALLGQGDMLYQPPGTGYPQRVHGAFVSDSEVHRVVEYLKSIGQPNYIEGILSGGEEGGEGELSGEGGAGGGEVDPLYDEAVAIVLKSRRASISSVQRQLRIGYNRAARLIEDMERAGLVSAMQSNGNREVLAPSGE